MTSRLLLALLLTCSLAPALPAQKKKAADNAAFVKVPDNWLMFRFVQSNVGPKTSYKVGLVLPPGAKTPKITRTSGREAVDGIAFDYAKHIVSKSPQLAEASKTKELVFNLELVPPVMDASEKSEAGRQPVPKGEEYHTPVPKMVFSGPNQSDGAMITKASYLVIFPPAGGYAKEALVLSSSGNPGKDLFQLRNAVINWQTIKKSDRPFGFTFDMTSRRVGFGGRFSND